MSLFPDSYGRVRRLVVVIVSVCAMALPAIGLAGRPLAPRKPGLHAHKLQLLAAIATRRRQAPRLAKPVTIRVAGKKYTFESLLGIGSSPVFFTTDRKHTVKLIPPNLRYGFDADVLLTRYLASRGNVEVSNLVAVGSNQRMPPEVAHHFSRPLVSQSKRALVIVKKYRAGLNHHERRWASGRLGRLVKSMEPALDEARKTVLTELTAGFDSWFRENSHLQLSPELRRSYESDFGGKSIADIMMTGVDLKDHNWILSPDGWVFIDP